MPIFAPLYRSAPGQSTQLSKQQKRDRKRKRDQDDSSDSDDTLKINSSPPPEATPRTASTAFHAPINRTDPYHVAGLSRTEALPPAPFPHAAVKRPLSNGTETIEQQLAELNPPLFVPKASAEDQSSSLKRRHVENLTTLLHTCMLRGDWERASRAWGLLLRTEVGGQGMDLRREGRWGVGAELLMRRGAGKAGNQTDSAQQASEGSSEDSSPFADEGFKLAREYYERLILQYPYTQYTRHTINASVFYPALFNIWVFEVQDRAKRNTRRGKGVRRRSGTPTSPSLSNISGHDSLGHGDEDDSNVVPEVRKQELDEALPIAARLDELMVSPPYDSSAELLHLRGMVGLWLVDLHTTLSHSPSFEEDPSEPSSPRFGSGVNDAEAERQRGLADAERWKAIRALRKARKSGLELNAEVMRMLEEAGDTR